MPNTPRQNTANTPNSRRHFLAHSSKLLALSGLTVGSLLTVTLNQTASAQDKSTSPTSKRILISKRPGMINDKAELAIKRGLSYLARSQSRDGSWRTRSGYGHYPVAMTALAGLALLAGGNTPVEGKYAANVRRAVEYTLRMASQNKNGLIAATAEEQRPMYGHGFSTLFLGEVYGMERDPDRQKRIEKILKKAIDLTAKSQSTAGGWLYTPDSGGDEGSVTITQIQGLRSCRNAGIKVPKKTIDGALKYIEKSANPDGGIRYRATGGGSSRAPLTAAACRGHVQRRPI